MKKTFTILIAAIAAIMLITQPITVMGQSKGYTELFSIASDDVVTNTKYQAYSTTVSDRDYVITFGGNSKSVGSNGTNIGSCTLSSYTKYAVSPVTSSVHASAFACKNSISNVSKITYTYTGGSNNTNTQVYLIYSSDNSTFSQVSLTTGTQGADICSANGTYTYEFSPLTGYFALLFKQKTNSSSDNWRIDAVTWKFYKTTYTITYNANEATGGTVPTATTHDAGSNATVANNTGSLERTGFVFGGWNTQANGLGTDYEVGATISGISQDYTLYAKWTAASSPNIVVSGDGISDNALNLAYTASGDQTATASYNNMSGYTNATVTRYNDLACTEEFSGSWFTANLNESDKTQIDYSASANTGAARTVYMRVSAVYNTTTYYSNVITITQAALPCTVTYDKNNAGASGSMSDGSSPYAYGSTVTVLANGFTAPTGKVFYKWNTASDGTGTYYVKDNTFTIERNTTLYAIWNDVPTYTMITSVSQIVPGAHYVVVGTKADGTVVKAMDAQNGSYRDAVNVTIKAKDTDDDGEDDTYYLQQTGLYEFVISGYTDNFTIYDESNATPGYLYHYGDKDVRLKSTLDNTAKWKITYDGTLELFKFNNVSASSYYLQFNSGSPRFTDYTGTQRHCYLFLKDNDTDIHPYSPSTYTNGSDVKITEDLSITANNKITINNGAKVSVTGTLTNTTAANLVIEDGGQLILAKTNTGVAATVKKNVSAATAASKTDATNWYAISAGVANPSILDNTNLITETSTPYNYDLYRFNEEENAGYAWENYRAHSTGAGADFTTLEKGRGYLYRNASDLTITMTGDINVEDIDEYDVTKTGTGEYAGFNLIGNPYTHNIYKGAGTAITSGTSTLSTGFYYLEPSTGKWAKGTDQSTAIAPNQGILVQVNETGNIKMTNTNSNGVAKSNNDYIMLSVANSQYSDEAYAWFDKGIGLNKIEHRNSEIPMLYINQNDENFAIATMSDETQSFNLNFKAATMGKYTLSYETKGEYSYLHVIDRLTGEDVDMLLDGEYSFIASPIDSENRFIVRLEYSAGSEISESSVFAYQSGSDIIVNGEGELQIFDVMGRRILTQYVSGVETINLQSHGVYIFKLNEKTQKIVVK